jgi:Leucine-rich repeat (LRR) protein
MKVVFGRKSHEETDTEKVEFHFSDFHEFETNPELKKHFESHDILELDCQNSGLTEFPDFLVPKLAKCKIFSLCKNELQSLPNGLCLFSCTEFRVSNNKLERLPDDLLLPECAYFYAGTNRLTKLPKNLLLPKCIEVHLVQNNLRVWPESIHGQPSCRYINLACNQLQSLPENMDFPECKTFSVGWNSSLTSLPRGLGLPRCRNFFAGFCALTSIPPDLMLPNCTKIILQENFIKELPERLSVSLGNVTYFELNNNRLEKLPENLNLLKCKTFDVERNCLQSLPSIRLPVVEYIDVSGNDIREIPPQFYEFPRLRELHYSENPNLIQSVQFLRFIENLNLRLSSLVWENRENVHEHRIQMSLRESIHRIMSRKDLLVLACPEKGSNSTLPPENCTTMEKLRDIIGKLPIINPSNKQFLLEFIEDETIHSTLCVKISDVLFAVLQIIEKDFDRETQNEIYNCLDSEIRDSVGKCFTGKITRLVNALNGFSSLVHIGMSDVDFIISVIKNAKQELGQEYTIQKHIEIVRGRLQAEKFSEQVIQDWLDHIE